MADNFQNEKFEFPVVGNFSPEVPVEIIAEIGDNNIKVVAMVDTGFSGFLQAPMAVGMKANLRLLAMSTYTLADKSKVKNIECFGKVRFANKEIFGIITLSETSDDALVGMQFLKQLEMDFTVSTKNKKAIFSSVKEDANPPIGNTDDNHPSPNPISVI